MRKFACIVAFSLLMCSCNNSRFEEVKTENELLRKETAQKDSVIDFFISSANRIAENISLITQKEKVLGGETRSKKKFTEEDRNRILEEINGINLLIRENKVIIDSLITRLTEADFKLESVEKMVQNLYRQLEEKNTEINALKHNLADVEMAFNTVDFWLDALTSRNVELEAQSSRQKNIIDQQQELLHTAWYRYGTFKELKAAGILTKEKGLLTRNEKLGQNFSNAEFRKINIGETANISLPGEKVKIVSSHPPGSYLLTKAGKSSILTINQPGEFWKVTRYLVVVLE